MAEEGDEVLDDIPEEEEEDKIRYGLPRKKGGEEKKKPCNPRIDELATPNKRIFLALWNEHAYHFPKDKVNRLKQLLQQLYAMSPEETAKYFAEVRAEAKAAAMRRKLKQKLRKYLLEKRHQKQRECAYKLFRRVLKCGMTYAAENPVPPVVSIRLRYLSDIILEQLCDLRKIGIPNRSNTDKLGNFMISVADWMAIAVERLYYSAQQTINAMTEQPLSQEPDERSQVSGGYKDLGQPLAQSSVIGHSQAKQNQTELSSSYKEMGRPLAQSSSIGPIQTSRDQNKTVGAPASYKNMGHPAAHSSVNEAKSFLSATKEVTPQDETKATTPKKPQEPYYSLIEPTQKYLPTTPMMVSGMEQSVVVSNAKKSKDDTGYSSGFISGDSKTRQNETTLWGNSFH